jgi:hypothetical protein
LPQLSSSASPFGISKGDCEGIDLKRENLINNCLRLFKGDMVFLTLHLPRFPCILAVAIGTKQAISQDVSEKLSVLTERDGCDTRFTFVISKIIFLLERDD